MYHRVWTQILEKQTTLIDMPLPRTFWSEIHAAFDEFVEWTLHYPDEAAQLDAIAKQWRLDSGHRLFFSNYFSPYFRNRAGQPGKDRKQIIQFCPPFLQYLNEHYPTWLLLPPYRRLVEKMIVALFETYRICVPIVHALAEFDPTLAAKLMPAGQVPPIALRLLRYESDGLFGTNPHVDKSAITVILHADDDKETQCLVFAPAAAESPPKLSAFAPIEKDKGQSILFVGAAPAQAGHVNLRPAGHAVRACSTRAVRHSAVFFWLLPDIDMDAFDTTIPFLDDTGFSRPIAG